MKVIRSTARVLPVDAGGRVLLLLGRGLLWRGEPFWMSVGGAVTRGETLAQAGARELREETGIAAEPGQLGVSIGDSVIQYAWSRVLRVTQHQAYFALLVDDTAVSFAGQGLLERRCIEEYRWLSAEALEDRPERLADPELPSLIRAAVATGRPREVTHRREVP